MNNDNTNDSTIACAYCGQQVPFKETVDVFWLAQRLPVAEAAFVHECIPVTRAEGQPPRVIVNEPSGIAFPPATCNACWHVGKGE
jgi:DNA-directed RNA polymerase subunit RPC12/RpoP